MEQLINDFKKHWRAVVESYKNEILGLRAGRVNPAMVEDIQAESYGAKMPLKQLATITSDSGHSLIIQPWDKSVIPGIEKAIRDAQLGVNPSNDGNIIRLNFPPLTEEKRQVLVKLLGQKTEEHKIKFRQLRDDSKRKFQTEMSAKGGSASGGEKGFDEDLKFKFNDLLQKEVDAFNTEIDALREKKEKEILSV